MNKYLLLISLLSPLAEIFPQYNGSWWYYKITDEDIKKYKNFRFYRLLFILLVWMPIIYYIPIKYIEKKLISILLSITFLHREYYNNNISNYLYISTIIFLMIFIYINTNKIFYISLLYLFSGIYFLSKYKYKNIKMDILGRLLFSIGIIIFLFNINNLHT